MAPLPHGLPLRRATRCARPKNQDDRVIGHRGGVRSARKSGCKVGAEKRGESPMNTVLDDVRLAPMAQPTVASAAELERLGDEIAELSTHLDAATARLPDLIQFDARDGWNTGFLSCAQWLSWRVGLDRGAARERVRVARGLGTLPRPAQ